MVDPGPSPTSSWRGLLALVAPGLAWQAAQRQLHRQRPLNTAAQIAEWERLTRMDLQDLPLPGWMPQRAASKLEDLHQRLRRLRRERLRAVQEQLGQSLVESGYLDSADAVVRLVPQEIHDALCRSDQQVLRRLAAQRA